MACMLADICFLRFSGIAISFFGDGLVEDDEAVPVGREGVNSGALALAVMAFLAWVILMVGA